MPDPSVTTYETLGANAPVTTSEPVLTATNAAANAAGNAAGSASGATGSIMDIAKAIMGTGTAKGAALGALFTELLKNSASGQGVVRPMDMSKYTMPSRATTVAAPRFVPYSEYGARDVPAVSQEIMKSFGAPSGLGSLLPVSQYSAVPKMATREPMTFSSVGSGRNVMPTLDITPRSTKPISPLTGALLGGALGYLVTPESKASEAGARAAGSLLNVAGGAAKDIAGGIAGALGDFISNLAKGKQTTGGNVGPNVPTGSAGEAYFQQAGKTYAISPDGSTRLVYDPKTGGGSAGGYDPSQFGGTDAIYTLPSDFSFLTNPYSGVNFGGGMTYTPPSSVYEPTFSGGSQTGSYYLPSSDSYYGDYSDYGSFGFKDGGMAVPLMANGGIPEPSFYTYGTVVDPMQMLSDSQGMAQGGRPQSGLHVPTVEGRHDYRAGSRVMGPGDGQSDDIPAMLADGEYVFDAETVAQLGNGSSKAGSDMLDKFREEIRAHKRSAPVNKIPPASKSPLQYLKQAQSRSKKNG